MASTTQETLLEEFRKVAAGLSTAAEADAGTVVSTASQRAASTAQESAASKVGSVVTTVLKSGFGIAPLVADLVGLFGGGGGEDAVPELVKYAMPAAIDFEAVESGGAISAADFDQSGTARAVRSVAGGAAQSVASPAATAPAAAPQITVNVQAMDARSFLDRSADIAQAVREAMLNSSSLNDVVSDL